jgi:hypothetical protein
MLEGVGTLEFHNCKELINLLDDRVLATEYGRPRDQLFSLLILILNSEKVKHLEVCQE